MKYFYLTTEIVSVVGASYMNKNSTIYLLSVFLVFSPIYNYAQVSETVVSISNGKWYFDGKILNEGSLAEGLLMNVRMVNSVFEDKGKRLPEQFRGFDPEANTRRFISMIPEYVSSGVNCFTISLQGGAPGYEGAVNTAYKPDGSLRKEYMNRVDKVIRAASENNAAIILSCFYQRQHSHNYALDGSEAIKSAVANTVRWLKENRFKNVILEVSNEYRHDGFLNWKDGNWFVSSKGQVELIRLAKTIAPEFIVGTSGMGDGTLVDSLVMVADYLTVHFNTTSLSDYPEKISRLIKTGKPVVCNEDDKTGRQGAAALTISVENGCGWGYMNNVKNQKMPFSFEGTNDDTAVYNMMKNVTTPGYSKNKSEEFPEYFPVPDSFGGWRTLSDEKEILYKTGIDKAILDSVFEYVRSSTRNGGLLVLRHGWLVYENYFGKGQRDATPNLASCGKSFTSMAVGILMNEHSELFPDGLDQKIFTPAYLPQFTFPLSDPMMADIKLGQLLSFSAGIRGNNPVYINGEESSIDPPGPDGWFSMLDSVALGKMNFNEGKRFYSAKTLWCKPGGGYSYASSSIHIAAIMLKHITGESLMTYIDNHLAKPLGWGNWGYGYKNTPAGKNPGAGGIALRSTDVLRFGYLLLHKGKWGDKQLVPAEFVEKATNASPYNPHYPYSLQFNVNTNGERSNIPRDAFWKTGSGGHCIYVVPSLDLVVWKLGGRNDQYGQNNTGIAEPAGNNNNYGPTEKISAILDGNEYAKVLEMVIGAIAEQ